MARLIATVSSVLLQVLQSAISYLFLKEKNVSPGLQVLPISFCAIVSDITEEFVPRRVCPRHLSRSINMGTCEFVESTHETVPELGVAKPIVPLSMKWC